MTKEPYRVYLVEDDGMLAEEISKLLMKWGYEVRSVQMFDNILEEFLAVQPHVVLMDVNIPSFDGFYWCKRIREVSAVPIVYISSRDSSMDVIMGMNNGGDDYLMKPFDNAVLVARPEDIMLINSPVGMPGRAIRNPFVNDIMLGCPAPIKGCELCLKDCSREYCIIKALENARLGNVNEGIVFAGKNVGQINSILPVQKIFDNLVQEVQAEPD